MKKSIPTKMIDSAARQKTVAIIGMGLIGGSLALALKTHGLATTVLGIEADDVHAKKALECKLVDQIVDLETAMLQAAIIILAIPVNAAEKLLPEILDACEDHIVLDVGSTKAAICNVAFGHNKGSHFVATHPMWGTEFSGPEAAQPGAFAGKAVVICSEEFSSSSAVAWVENMYTTLGMHLLYMSASSHDLHAAYVSHISHITSFALANTVLEKEKEDEAIFEMASGGFESTVRLAKSNPSMWLPIFMENKENVLDVLNEHIAQLKKFKSCLEKENVVYLKELMENANKITRILK